MLVLTRDPVAERIGAVVVAALTRTVRGLVSELELTPGEDGVSDALRPRHTTVLSGSSPTSCR